MKQIIVFTLPEQLLRTHATGTALDAFMRAAGGATIQNGHGVWYPAESGAAPVVEEVISVRFACGDQHGYNVWELMVKDVCRAAFGDGEKAVYVETLSPRGTTWNIYKPEDVQ